MELTCPDCHGSVQMSGPRTAACPVHGTYEVLFDGETPVAVQSRAAVAEVAKAVDGNCEVHPKQAAVAACFTCGKQLCTLCSYEVNGRAFCSDCGVAQASVAATVAPRLSARRAVVQPGRCSEHPEVESIVHCRLCARPMCATCDFSLPGDVHLCAACIENQSSEDVSPKRKKFTYIALALASWSTILSALLFGGAFNEMLSDPDTSKVADLVVTNIILWPLLVGTGLSLSALDKRLKNTGLMKGVAWWNGIMAALFLLLVLAANLGLMG